MMFEYTILCFLIYTFLGCSMFIPALECKTKEKSRRNKTEEKNQSSVYKILPGVVKAVKYVSNKETVTERYALPRFKAVASL